MNLLRRHAAVLASSLLLGFALPAGTATAVTKTTAAAKSTVTKTTTAKTTTAKTTTAKTTTAPKTTTTVKTPAKTTTAAPTLAGRLAAVKVSKTINYYPSMAGWSKMWTSWNAAKVDADLAKAQSLGATSVRIIVFPNTFGYPNPKPTYTAMLDDFVEMAAARGMTSRFTLFDWWDGYGDVAGSTTWASTILKPYANDPRVISVELQNEFNPSNAAGVAWAKKIIPAVRAAAPAMPLTFSIDGTSGIPGLTKMKATFGTSLDYYDYHFYGNSERALTALRQALAAVAPSPLVVGETGLSTLGFTEGEQAAFLGRVYEAAEIAGIKSIAVWTLVDFANGAIPTSQVGSVPAQYSYGLFRLDGTPKPSAAVVKAGWAGADMPADLLDPSFEAPAGQSAWRAFMPELGMGVKTQATVRTGKWAMAFSDTGKNASGVPSVRVAPVTPVQPGQKWTAEVYARGNAATGTNQVSLSWFDANDKWLGGSNSAILTGTTGWTRLTAAGTAPAGSASMQIHLKSGENTGTVWFDDFKVVGS